MLTATEAAAALGVSKRHQLRVQIKALRPHPQQKPADRREFVQNRHLMPTAPPSTSLCVKVPLCNGFPVNWLISVAVQCRERLGLHRLGRE